MKTIKFADHGQDFLEWDIDGKGVVVGCRPFQGNIWGGRKVLNHRSLTVGGQARIKIAMSPIYIKYPITHIVTARLAK